MDYSHFWKRQIGALSVRKMAVPSGITSRSITVAREAFLEMLVGGIILIIRTFRGHGNLGD